MVTVARMALEGGSSILVEVDDDITGPVKAGRIGAAIRELPQTLQEALGPVTDTARTVLAELRKADPTEVAVEFGVDLAFEAGAVMVKGGASCHLKVTMIWGNRVEAAA